MITNRRAGLGATASLNVASARTRVGLLVVCALLALCGVSACSSAALNELQWVDMTWASQDAGGDMPGGWDRAALLIPVRIDGAEYLFQLDTGAGNSYLNRNWADQAGIRYELMREIQANAQVSTWLARLKQVELAGLRYEGRDVLIHQLAPDPDREEVEAGFSIEGEVPQVAGIIGMDLLRSRFVVLDFVRSRFALSTKRPAVSGHETRIALWGGRPVITLEGALGLKAAFDTGSSAYSLICGQALLRELTREGANSWTIQTTGGDGLVEIQAANCRMSLKSGSIDIPISTLYATELIDQIAGISQGQVNAIIGNEAFRDRVVVLDLHVFIVSTE